jgi:sec-independent protein translocase protein TatA
MFGLGVQEVLIVCLIGLVLFGKGLPQLARSLGKTVAEFRAQLSGTDEDVRQALR